MAEKNDVDMEGGAPAVSFSNDDLNKVFRMRRTLTQMLKKRGYIVPEDELSQTLDGFKNQVNGAIVSSPQERLRSMGFLGTMYEHENRRDFIQYKFTDSEKKLPLQTLKNHETNHRGLLKERLNRLKTAAQADAQLNNTTVEDVSIRGHLIIVCRAGISPSCKTYAGTMIHKQEYSTSAGVGGERENLTMNIEFFEEDELLVDITEHELVPKHEKMSETQKQELLARYKLKESQLPRLLAEDPISRFYGLQRNDVVRITRPSETAGRYITYRIVF